MRSQCAADIRPRLALHHFATNAKLRNELVWPDSDITELFKVALKRSYRSFSAKRRAIEDIGLSPITLMYRHWVTKLGITGWGGNLQVRRRSAGVTDISATLHKRDRMTFFVLSPGLSYCHFNMARR
jgi:hypothetical protein